MLPAVWAPSPDYKEAKGVIANYVEALTKAAPPRVVALSSMGANRTSGLGMITALSLLEQGFRDLTSPIAFVRAGGFFENFLYGLQVAQGGTLPVYYNPTNRKSTMVATNDIGAEVATLLTGPAWSGQRVVELGSMVSADEVAEQLGEVLNRRRESLCGPACRVGGSVRAIRHPEGPHRTCRRNVRGRECGMDGPRGRGYGARRGYDVRTRCIRGCTERRQGVSPGRIRHETEADGCGRRGASLVERLVQIEPVGIHSFNQGELGAAVAGLDLLLAGDGVDDPVIPFVPDQKAAAVVPGERRARAVAMLEERCAARDRR